MLRFIHRSLLAAVFVWSSLDALPNADERTAPADALDLPKPSTMVRVHGGVNLLGGVMLALNIKPKLVALAMIGNLIPTTLGGHRFWEEDEPGARINQMVHFMKNVSLLGGLLGVLAEGSGRAED